MSPPELPPPLRHYSAGQIALIVIGIILMLPGACALVFMTQMAGEVRWSDPITQMIITLWAICFAVSAIGVVLIVVARKRARTAL
jgi:hypothetical protein